MAKTKRSKEEREQQRIQIIELLAQGLTQAVIADRLGLSQPQINYDIQLIRKRWREQQDNDFEELTAQQIAKIDLTERDYWQGWNTSRNDPSGRALPGDPAYLAGVLNCVRQRCKLLGIDAVVKYRDINEAISTVKRAGYEISDPSHLV
jgi:biotin operon repressor